MSKTKDKVIDDQNKKIESEADNIRTKYPEIAKMTVAEVVATDLFAEKLKGIIANYNKRLDYYAFKSLNKIFETENFRKEYIAWIKNPICLMLSVILFSILVILLIIALLLK